MRILFFTTALCLTANLFSQEQERFCGATEVQNKWFSTHPEQKANFDILQQQAIQEDKDFVNNRSQMRTTSAANFTIPIVFHILHTGGSENISDAQVQDAVNILNRDFRKLNPDTNDVVVPFKTLIGDAKIIFSLAGKDPNGNCTNGIVRHYDTRTAWDSDDFSYYAYTWPPTRYLNIYVVKTINSNAAGYTYLPGSGIPSSVDCIVILSNYVGASGTGNVYLSRALTHEVGHWFNLPHVWGGTNQPGVSCGDDGVSDTPVTEGHSNCGALNNSANCNPNIPENVQNYMDYSYCSRMYTIGQANRMQNAAASMVSGRNNLSSVNNLFITGVTDPLTTCVPMLEIAVPTTSVCAGSSLPVYSYTSNAVPTTYLWASNDASFANPSAPNTIATFNNPGPVTVSCTVSNANGSTVKVKTVNVLLDANNIGIANVEGFETVGLPSSWTVVNPTSPTVKWEITSDAAKLGFNSVFVQGENAPANTTEILESPSYNFKANPGAKFIFHYAYARHNVNNKDKFKVQASKDCGGSWADIWTPTNATMAQSSGGTTAVTFIPTNSQWVMYNVTDDSPFFQPFETEANVRFRFSFQEDIGGTGYGNRIYLDNFIFTIPVGVNEITKSINFNVYPNPSSADFNVNFTLSQSSAIKYQVVSATGAVLIKADEKTFAEGDHVLKINETNQLASGIYFLNFEMNGIKLNKKLIVN